MNTNDFCVQVITPTNNENAVCLYKYAAYGLPNFIIYGLYGVIGAGLTAVCISGENVVTLCLAVLFGLGTAFCAVISAAFLAFYLFAGFFVGLWFQFGVYIWALQTSRPELLSVSLFIFVDILCAILKETNWEFVCQFDKMLSSWEESYFCYIDTACICGLLLKLWNRESYESMSATQYCK